MDRPHPRPCTCVDGDAHLVQTGLEPAIYDPGPPVLNTSLEALEIDPQTKALYAGRSISANPSPSVAFRHSGWQPDRRRIAEALTRTSQPFARRQAFESCGAFAYVLRSIDDPDRYCVAGSGCHDRFCLPCATERSTFIAANAFDLVQGKDVRFLTLTIKTTGLTLSESLDKLYTSFTALRRRAFWTKRVKGGAAFLELTWSKNSKTWHPHLHCLIEGIYLPHRLLKEAWYAITTDSYIVDIRPAGDARSVSNYVTKYASKPFNTTYLHQPHLLDEALLALAGRKLAITFGTWRGNLLAQHTPEGNWERVCTLDQLLTNAKRFDDEARRILASITDVDLEAIYALCPDAPPPRPPHYVDPQEQFIFGAWSTTGCFAVPATTPPRN